MFFTKKLFVIFITVLVTFSLASCKNSEAKIKKEYLNFINESKSQGDDSYYFLKNIDGNKTAELIILSNTKIDVYTYENAVKEVGSHDFITATVQFFETKSNDYPGIIYKTVGGGKEHLGYINILEENLSLKPTFDIDFGITSGQKEDITFTDDEQLISISKKAYKENYEIQFKYID